MSIEAAQKTIENYINALLQNNEDGEFISWINGHDSAPKSFHEFKKAFDKIKELNFYL